MVDYTDVSCPKLKHILMSMLKYQGVVCNDIEIQGASFLIHSGLLPAFGAISYFAPRFEPSNLVTLLSQAAAFSNQFFYGRTQLHHYVQGMGGDFFSEVGIAVRPEASVNARCMLSYQQVAAGVVNDRIVTAPGEQLWSHVWMENTDIAAGAANEVRVRLAFSGVMLQLR